MPLSMKNNFLLTLIVIIFLNCSVLSSNTNKVDSLQKLLSFTSTDTAKVNILNNLFYVLRFDSTDLAISYAKQALELSENIDYESGMAASLGNVGLGFFYSSDYNKAIEYLSKSIEISKKIKDSLQLSKSTENIALNYQSLGKNDTALKLLKQNLELNKNRNDKHSIAVTYVNIANIYSETGQYTIAIEKYYNSLEIFENLGEKLNFSKSLNNIGNIFNRLKEYNKALEYYEQAFAIKQELNDKRGSANLLNNIGAIYYFEDNFEKANNYFIKSLKIREEIGSKYGIASSLSNIGMIYRKLNNLNKALEYQTKALEIKKEIGSKESIASSYTNIGGIYQEKKDYPNALNYYTKAYDIVQEIGDKLSEAKNTLAFAKVYALMNNYKKAYDYYNLYHQQYDSLFNSKMSNQIAEMQTKYKTEKKEKEIQLQKIEIEQKGEKIKQKNLQRNMLFIGLILVLIILIVLYISFRQKRKSYAFLSKQKTDILEKNEELKQQKEEILAQAEQLENANTEITRNSKLKDLFFASMSHEIRTPINVIVGFTNLLLNAKIPKKQNAYVENIRNSGKSLLVIINDILDFSKIEAGKLEIELVNFNLSELTRNLYSIMLVKANEKKVILNLNIDKKLPDIINGDPVRLNQILTNLIANAIKFTNEGGKISIEAKLIEESEAEINIKFSISDTGIGIPENRLNSIFEDYTQADVQTTRKYGGTGLGLSIVKKLLDLQNGEISVQSEVNKGSTFSFNIPYMASNEKLIVKGTKSTKIQLVKKINDVHILLVDDNMMNRILAIDTIHMFNDKILIDEAQNGKVAIKMLQEKKYDLVLMDLLMPEMDGYEATETIRNKLNPPVSKIPILGMTANALDEEREKCISIGMNDYITKPFEPDELFEKIIALTK